VGIDTFLGLSVIICMDSEKYVNEKSKSAPTSIEKKSEIWYGSALRMLPVKKLFVFNGNWGLNRNRLRLEMTIASLP